MGFDNEEKFKSFLADSPRFCTPSNSDPKTFREIEINARTFVLIMSDLAASVHRAGKCD
jgi:hypothetical protein